MRLGKTTVLTIALLAWVASPLLAQTTPPAKPTQSDKAPQPAKPPQAEKTKAPQAPKAPQANKAPEADKGPTKTAPATKAGPPSTTPAAPKPQAPAKAPADAQKAAKPPAKGTAAAPAAPKTTKKAAPSPKPPARPKEGSATAEPVRVSRRDPFNPLVGQQNQSSGAGEHLPAGKAGLQVSTLRVDGVVKAPNGMIAVASNPQQRVYFLREGDQLYDGRVEHITMEGVSFHETGKDAFGKPVEREVTKRLYPTPGEQR